MKIRQFHILLLAAAVVLMAPLAPAQAPVTLYSFAGGDDGDAPAAPLIQASDGNFYGTTSAGGKHGQGTIFRFTPPSTHVVLHSFNNKDLAPLAGLVEGSDGFLYGTTSGSAGTSLGTVFKIKLDGTQFKSYSPFSDATGALPGYGALVFGSDGNLYGTTIASGTGAGEGTVYSITTSGDIKTLHVFHHADGSIPEAGLTIGADGFYGTTSQGGANGPPNGFGVAYKITMAGAFTLLNSFNDPVDDPRRALVLGKDGNFYGTLSHPDPTHPGSIYSMKPDGTLNPLLSFTGPDGSCPFCSLILGKDGNLYGTTRSGGARDGGTCFMVTTAGALTTLAHFGGPRPAGSDPWAGLVQATDGNLYGTTTRGGSTGHGTVFVLVRPTVPVLTATAQPGKQVALSWTTSTESAPGTGIAGYRVFQDGVLVKTIIGASTTFTVTGLVECKEYCFTVSAYDSAGNASAQSVKACATTLDETPPPAPSAPTLNPISSSQIDVSWSPVTDVGCADLDGYVVLRYGGSPRLVSGDTSFSDTGLAEYEEYCYSVYAVDKNGNSSAPSSQTCARTPDVTPPTIPPNLTAVAVGSNQIRLDWQPSTDTGIGLAGYSVFRKGFIPRAWPPGSGGIMIVWRKIGTVGPSTRTYTDSGLKPGTEYCYRVAAFDAATPKNQSALGGEACATTVSLPECITQTITGTGGGSAVLWDIGNRPPDPTAVDKATKAAQADATAKANAAAASALCPLGHGHKKTSISLGTVTTTTYNIPAYPPRTKPLLVIGASCTWKVTIECCDR